MSSGSESERHCTRNGRSHAFATSRRPHLEPSLDGICRQLTHSAPFRAPTHPHPSLLSELVFVCGLRPFGGDIFFSFRPFTSSKHICLLNTMSHTFLLQPPEKSNARNSSVHLWIVHLPMDDALSRCSKQNSVCNSCTLVRLTIEHPMVLLMHVVPFPDPQLPSPLYEVVVNPIAGSGFELLVLLHVVRERPNGHNGGRVWPGGPAGWRL